MFKSWRYIPHTADMQFVSKGKTLEEAFKNAAYATFNYLVDPKKVKKAVKKEIKIKAKRDISLLYDYLEEMLYLLDTEGFLLAEVEKIKITEKEGELTLKATIHGDIYTKENKYDIHGNIKSVTYNDMCIKKTDGGYELTVVLDI